MTSVNGADGSEHYDEFAFLKDYAEHEDIPWRGQPQVERRFVDVGGGQSLSALVWGPEEPELVFIHGSGQNAHTWDSVALKLDRPMVALDLPGHGRSDWRDDHDYRPWSNAKAVAAAISQLAPQAHTVVGMSLGGLTTMRLSAERPDLVGRTVIVDVTPGVTSRVTTMTRDQRGTTALIGGQKSFDSFEEMLAATAATAPHRPIESLRPGVLHNSRREADGSWVWRYDSQRAAAGVPDNSLLWDDVSAIAAPIMLVRGGRSVFVHDDDVSEFLSRQPDTRIEVVDGAGHSVQSDRPVVLAGLIEDFVATTKATRP